MEGNGEISRLKAYLTIVKDVLNTFGLPTIVLIVLLLLWTGTIKSPLSEAKTVIEDIKVSIDRHLERDEEVIFYMKGMCLSNAKLANTPLEECLWRRSR